jgi:hypothetical protein
MFDGTRMTGSELVFEVVLAFLETVHPLLDALNPMKAAPYTEPISRKVSGLGRFFHQRRWMKGGISSDIRNMKCALNLV